MGNATEKDFSRADFEGVSENLQRVARLTDKDDYDFEMALERATENQQQTIEELLTEVESELNGRGF